MSSPAARDVVVVAASAGGVEALREFVGALPGDLAAAVIVVLHLPATSDSVLPAILARAGSLPTSQACNGEELRNAHIYVAPPGQHVTISARTIALSTEPRENGHRPAADPLFRSAAAAFGPRAIGIVLSGSLDDGAAGLVSIARHGGYAMVQDPAEALHAGMPRSALHVVPDASVAPVAELATLLVARLHGGGGEPPHLSAVRSEILEAALWTALRCLDERVTLSRRMAGPAHARSRAQGETYDDAAAEAEAAAAAIRELLLQRDDAIAVVPAS